MTPARRSSTYRHNTTPSAGLVAIPMAIFAALIAAWILPNSVGFTTDSESYLDVARSLREGRGLVQMVTDFWRPALPDPLGMWPPLYPLLIAGVSRLGFSLEAAARVVSAVSFVVFAVAFHGLAVRAAGERRARVVTPLALVTPGVALASGMAWSESLFMALVTLSLMGLATVEVHPVGRRRAHDISRIAVLSGLAAGLAALTRYLGLIVIPIAIVSFVIRSAHPRVMITWTISALLLPIAWTIRNLLVFHSPFGPGLPGSHLGPLAVIGDLIGGLRWSLIPWPVQAIGPLAAVVLLGLFVLVGIAFARRGIPALIAVTVIAYLVALLVARSQWTFNLLGERYLTPVLPLMLLAAAASVAGMAGRVHYIDRVALVLAILMGAGSVVTLARRFATPEYLAERAARPESIDELRTLVPGSSDPVLSDVGHLVRSATGRAAVQVPSVDFSMRPLAAVDLARWQALGVREGIFRRPGDPASADTTPTAQRLGPWLAERVSSGGRESWTILAATDRFIRVRLP